MHLLSAKSAKGLLRAGHSFLHIPQPHSGFHIILIPFL